MRMRVRGCGGALCLARLAHHERRARADATRPFWAASPPPAARALRRPQLRAPARLRAGLELRREGARVHDRERRERRERVRRERMHSTHE